MVDEAVALRKRSRHGSMQIVREELQIYRTVRREGQFIMALRNARRKHANLGGGGARTYFHYGTRSPNNNIARVALTAMA